jgi:cbb3-type cytochrome oxidase maturation protein
VNILYLLIPLALLIAGSAALAFSWSVRSGQLDDLDTPPLRIIAEDRND